MGSVRLRGYWAMAAAIQGCASCSSNARPAPRKTAASRSMRQMTESGPKIPAGPPAAADRTIISSRSRSASATMAYGSGVIRRNEAVSRSVEILQREPQSRGPLFEVIAEERRADQIIGDIRNRRFGGLSQRLWPALRVVVAAAEPHQREQFMTLGWAAPVDGVAPFLFGRFVRRVQQNLPFIVVGSVRPGRGVGLDGHLGIELARLGNYEGESFKWNGQHQGSLFLIVC